MHFRGPSTTHHHFWIRNSSWTWCCTGETSSFGMERRSVAVPHRRRSFSLVCLFDTQTFPRFLVSSILTLDLRFARTVRRAGRWPRKCTLHPFHRVWIPFPRLAGASPSSMRPAPVSPAIARSRPPPPPAWHNAGRSGVVGVPSTQGAAPRALGPSTRSSTRPLRRPLQHHEACIARRRRISVPEAGKADHGNPADFWCMQRKMPV